MWVRRDPAIGVLDRKVFRRLVKYFLVRGVFSEGGPLPSGVGGVSSEASASIFVPKQCGPFKAIQVVLDLRSTDLQSPPSLSHLDLANNETHTLHHG